MFKELINHNGNVSVLFSEPKIPQSERGDGDDIAPSQFQCSSASRKFLNRTGRAVGDPRRESFSALQRAENSSIVHFSISSSSLKCFSALQRAENSSIAHPFWRARLMATVSVLFSEPKIPQFSEDPALLALFRAFQCSSASRKFLNLRCTSCGCLCLMSFSALQRAENSSIGVVTLLMTNPRRFSALQRAENSSIAPRRVRSQRAVEFQCSSASRKFLNSGCSPSARRTPRFQCSSASRKFLNLTQQQYGAARRYVSVLFSEPKIPQYDQNETKRPR